MFTGTEQSAQFEERVSSYVRIRYGVDGQKIVDRNREIDEDFYRGVDDFCGVDVSVVFDVYQKWD